MTDKIKRLNKILNKKRLKGWLKPVDNLENSYFVLIENKRCVKDSPIIKREDYKALLERGKSYSPEIVHFLVTSNKRNLQHINNSFFSNRNGVFTIF